MDILAFVTELNNWNNNNCPSHTGQQTLPSRTRHQVGQRSPQLFQRLGFVRFFHFVGCPMYDTPFCRKVTPHILFFSRPRVLPPSRLLPPLWAQRKSSEDERVKEKVRKRGGGQRWEINMRKRTLR